MHPSIKPTLATAIAQSAGNRGALFKRAGIALAGSIALWISAKIQIPFYPVPFTMQTFMVLIIGAAFGWRLGFATVLLYLAEGACGLPVFAGTPEKGLGLAYMMGPTGGYLAGYLLAAPLCGWLAERGWMRSISLSAVAMLMGLVAIYTPGLLWLGTLVGWDKPIIAWGLAPFVVGELIKLGLAVALLSLIARSIQSDNR